MYLYCYDSRREEIEIWDALQPQYNKNIKYYCVSGGTVDKK